jgi:hypothetical protein
MFDKIRTMCSRTPTIETCTEEDLRRIGQELSAERSRLEAVRQLRIEDLDRLYREATSR